VGCNINTEGFRRKVLGPLLNQASSYFGFLVVARKGYKNDRSSAAYCCSAGRKCTFSFQVYWDRERRNWYIWASGTGSAHHSNHDATFAGPGRGVFVSPELRHTRGWKENRKLEGMVGGEHQVKGNGFDREWQNARRRFRRWQQEHSNQQSREGKTWNAGRQPEVMMETPNHDVGGRDKTLLLATETHMTVIPCTTPGQERAMVEQAKRMAITGSSQLQAGEQEKKEKDGDCDGYLPQKIFEQVSDLIGLNRPSFESKARRVATNKTSRDVNVKESMIEEEVTTDLKCASIHLKNADYWREVMGEDQKPTDINDTVGWSLFFFVPKKICSARRDVVVLGNADSCEKHLMLPILAVARNTAQVVGIRALHVTMHGAAGPNGYKKLSEDLPVHRLERSQNHLEGSRDGVSPIVFNTGKLVNHVAKLIQDDLPPYVNRILKHAKVDKKRNFVALHMGLTGTEATQWWTLKVGRREQIRLPGHLSVMDNVNEDVLRFIGRATNRILGAFEKEAFGKCRNKPLFLPATKERELLQLYLTEKFCLPEEERMRVEGVSIVMSNGGTMLHYDTKNDMREGHDWVVTASATFDMTNNPKWSGIDTAKLRASAINTRALTVMFIFYTRAVVGSKGEELKKLK